VLKELQGMAKTLEGLLQSAVDPALVRTTDAVAIVEAASAIEQCAAAVKTLYATRASESQVWANRGHRSPEDWLAQTTGTSYGQAAGTLNASEKLRELPKLEGAVRSGELSQQQLNELASAATPDNEQQLLEASKKQSFKQLRRTCANEKAKARSIERDEARHQRPRRAPPQVLDRRRGRVLLLGPGDHCDRGAHRGGLGCRNGQHFKAARAEGRNEPLAAYRLDALANLVCGGGAKVDTTVVIRVDERRLRGEDGLCEAVGTGAVPISEAIGAILAGAFVKIVLHDGVDISKVSHHGRHIPEVLRTAIHERDGYTCVRPGCGATTKLQIHHWVVDYGKKGATAYWNLASACPHDHYLLTHGGHRLDGGPGNWTWIPPP
jgi:hypothetical protein